MPTFNEKRPSESRPHYGAAFRKRYMGCPDMRCATLADHAQHDPIGPEHPNGYPTASGPSQPV